MLLLYFISLLSLVGYKQLKYTLVYFLSYIYKILSIWILIYVIFKCGVKISVEYEKNYLFVSNSAVLSFFFGNVGLIISKC